LFRPPNRLLRALLAIYVIVPVATVALALLGDLSRPVKVALLAMAVAPIPPILPGKQLKFGGEKSYVFGLLVAVSLVAIVLVPLGVDVLGRVFGRESRFSPIEVARLIGMTILAPLVVGLMLRHAAPRLAQAAAPWASRIGNVLLVVGLVPVLIKVWPTVAALVGDGSVLAIAALVVVAIVAGRALAAALAAVQPRFDRAIVEAQLPADAPGWGWYESRAGGFVRAGDGGAFAVSVAADPALPPELLTALRQAARAGTAGAAGGRARPSAARGVRVR